MFTQSTRVRQYRKKRYTSQTLSLGLQLRVSKFRWLAAYSQLTPTATPTVGNCPWVWHITSHNQHRCMNAIAYCLCKAMLDVICCKDTYLNAMAGEKSSPSPKWIPTMLSQQNAQKVFSSATISHWEITSSSLARLHSNTTPLVADAHKFGANTCTHRCDTTPWKH